MSMERLIAEASVLAGGAHQCAVLGHEWKSTGGRACPRRNGDGGGWCSQTAYECSSCGDVDYGYPGGPAHKECFEDGPCDNSCMWVQS